jgi:hypothetical protein
MSDRSRGERLQIMLSPDELALIDDFRFAKRMPSRAATVRELFRRGLAAEGFMLAPAGARSKDFGVDAKTARVRRQSSAIVSSQTAVPPTAAPARRQRGGDNGRA